MFTRILACNLRQPHLSFCLPQAAPPSSRLTTISSMMATATRVSKESLAPPTATPIKTGSASSASLVRFLWGACLLTQMKVRMTKTAPLYVFLFCSLSFSFYICLFLGFFSFIASFQMKSPQASVALVTWWLTGLIKLRANPTFHPKVSTKHMNL